MRRGREDHGARRKKLSIALSATFGRWWEEGGDQESVSRGEIDCYRCLPKEANKECPLCQGAGIIEMYGTPESNISPDETWEDLIAVVWMVSTCRKRSWTPPDFERQPSWFISAYFFLLPKILTELKRKRKAPSDGV